jgi:hypothetical protein
MTPHDPTRRWGLAGCLLLAILATAGTAVAAAPRQHGGAPGGAAPGGGMGGPGAGGGAGAGYGPGAFNNPGTSGGGRGTAPTREMPERRGNLQLGPPGRWWDDRKFAQNLGLRPEQQKRMDAVFNANKGTILGRFQALQTEEDRMQFLTQQKPLQEEAIFAQVDRVSQARAALEKANAHLVLLLRQEMDPAQIARLEAGR